MIEAFRYDALTGRWVAVVPGRKAAFRGAPHPAELPRLRGRCPFCPSHEADTEETVAALPAEGPWRVRVVHNLYPVVRPDARAIEVPSSGDPPVTSVPARGRHEVLIEAPEHDLDLPDMPVAHLADVVRMYRDRVRALWEVEGVKTVTAFRNRGRRAGSSQPHPHGQLTAITLRAPDVAVRHAQAQRFAQKKGGSLLEAVLAEELAAGERIVEENEHFVVLCPLAPHRGDQTWIVPRSPRGSLRDLPDALLAPAAEVLRRTLRRVRTVTGGVAYNLVFRMPPADAPTDDASFWYLDILPRRGGGAGFELGTGIQIVTVAPEATAEALRATAP